MKSMQINILLISTVCVLSSQAMAGELAADQLAIDVNRLQRDSGSNVTYLYNNNGTVNNSTDDIALAGTGSFSDDADVGYQVSGSKTLSQSWSINARILTSDLSKTNSFSDAGGELEIIRQPLTANFDAAHSVSATYDSELQSAEVNAVFRLNDTWDLFAGLAMVSLDETFNIVSDDNVSAGIGTYNINTSNDMLGPQIGVAFNYKPAANLGIYVIGKLAWLDNDANQNQVIDDSPSFTRNNSASGSHSSTMYDIRLGLSYYFTKQFALNAGYQLIDISDLALAENQFNTTAAGSNTLNKDASVSWDGFTLGLSYLF